MKSWAFPTSRQVWKWKKGFGDRSHDEVFVCFPRLTQILIQHLESEFNSLWHYCVDNKFFWFLNWLFSRTKLIANCSKCLSMNYRPGKPQTCKNHKQQYWCFNSRGFASVISLARFYWACCCRFTTCLRS